jgi:hypothetical protein
MKKFNRLEDIEAAKMNLRIKQLEKERAITKQWQEVKDALHPGTFIKNKISEWTPLKESSEKLVSDLMVHGAEWIIKKMSGK